MSKSKRNCTISKLSIFFKVAAFILPLPLYVVFTTFIFPSPNSGFLVLGIVGSFFIGLGFVSIAGLIDGLYFGHIITGGLLGAGALMIAISSVIMYTPAFYDALDEQHITFYFFVWLILLVLAIWYPFSRTGISSSLQERKISKTTIKSHTKGLKNFWWYESIQKNYGLGALYGLNKAFTLSYLIVIIVHLLIGWWKIMSPIIAVGTAISCVLSAILFLSSSMLQRSNKNRNLGKPYVVVGFIFLFALGASVLIYFFRT